MLIALYGARQLYKRHPSLGEKFGWLKSKM